MMAVLSLEPLRGRKLLNVAAILGLLYLAAICSQPTICRADEAPMAAPDLTQMSIEELMNISVTSASRKSENLNDAAAAIYVITQEDIRRSGAKSIPEALRMAPGLQVAQTNGNTWVVTARGFADRWAKKLLVLVDGRNVYTPLFSGVWWDVQDTMMEDIDRIEVIRGPGATMWGANAVNGVINIITKPADETGGGLVVAGGGKEERQTLRMRYGRRIGDNGNFRFYAKRFDKGPTAYRYWPGLVRPSDAGDPWEQNRMGFRGDWKLSGQDSLVVQGDMYSGNESQILEAYYLTQPYRRNTQNDINVSGGNIIGRWSRVYSQDSDASLQFYYDRINRKELEFGEKRNTFDLDFQKRFRPSGRHEVVWGLGYRQSNDSLPSTFWVSFNPSSEKTHLASAFLQDNIIVKPNRFRLTLGSKFEHNSYTGFEVQPNVRALWTPSSQHTVWAAVSRAVRTPSRWERTGRINNSTSGNPALPFLVVLFPNLAYDSEKLLAYELGYRTQPSKQFSLDITGFYNIYRDLFAYKSGAGYLETTPAPAHVVLPLTFANAMKGRTKGVELSTNWNVRPWWRLSGALTTLQMDLTQDPSTLTGWLKTPIFSAMEGSPRKHYSVRSYMDLPFNLELDSVVYVMGRVPRTNVPPYTRLDMRLSWHPKHNSDIEVSIIGQNLLKHPQNDGSPYFYEHREFDVGLDEKQSVMERQIIGLVTWKF